MTCCFQPRTARVDDHEESNVPTPRTSQKKELVYAAHPRFEAMPSADAFPRTSSEFEQFEKKFSISPEQDALRMQLMNRLQITSTSIAKAIEPECERICSLLRYYLNVESSFVTAVDENQQLVLGRSGKLPGLNESTTRRASFCAFTFLATANQILPVANALNDWRFRNNPLVVYSPHIRSYLGAPIRLNGYSIGALCCLGRNAREWQPIDQEFVGTLSESVGRSISQVVERITGEYVNPDKTGPTQSALDAITVESVDGDNDSGSEEDAEVMSGMSTAFMKDTTDVEDDEYSADLPGPSQPTEVLPSEKESVTSALEQLNDGTSLDIFRPVSPTKESTTPLAMAEVDVVALIEHATTHELQQAVAQTKELQAKEEDEVKRLANRLADATGSDGAVDASLVSPPSCDSLIAEQQQAVAYLKLADFRNAIATLEPAINKASKHSNTRTALLLNAQILLSEALLCSNRPADAYEHSLAALHIASPRSAGAAIAMFEHAKALISTNEAHAALSWLHDYRAITRSLSTPEVDATLGQTLQTQHGRADSDMCKEDLPPWALVAALEARATCALGDVSEAMRIATQAHSVAEQSQQRCTLATMASVQQKNGSPAVASLLLRRAIQTPAASDAHTERDERLYSMLADCLIESSLVSHAEPLLAPYASAWHKLRAAEAAVSQARFMWQSFASTAGIIEGAFGAGRSRQMKLKVEPHKVPPKHVSACFQRARCYLDEAWQLLDTSIGAAGGTPTATLVQLHQLDAYVNAQLEHNRRALKSARWLLQQHMASGLSEGIHVAALLYEASALVSLGREYEANARLKSHHDQLRLRDLPPAVRQAFVNTLAAVQAYCGQITQARDSAYEVLDQRPHDHDAALNAIFCETAFGRIDCARAIALQLVH